MEERQPLDPTSEVPSRAFLSPRPARRVSQVRFSLPPQKCCVCVCGCSEEVLWGSNDGRIRGRWIVPVGFRMLCRLHLSPPPPLRQYALLSTRLCTAKWTSAGTTCSKLVKTRCSPVEVRRRCSHPVLEQNTMHAGNPSCTGGAEILWARGSVAGDPTYGSGAHESLASRRIRSMLCSVCEAEP